MSLPVRFFSVADTKDGHRQSLVVDIIKNSINSHTNPPIALAVFQFLATRRARIFTQRQQSFLNRFGPRGRDCFVVFLGRRQDEYSVSHLRFRRFSARACSNGIGVSPEARASSHARMSSRSSWSSRSFSYSSTLMTTAIFSPFSLVRNWVGSFICYLWFSLS